MPVQSNQHGDFVGSVYDLPKNGLVLPDITKEDLLKALESSRPSVA